MSHTLAINSCEHGSHDFLPPLFLSLVPIALTHPKLLPLPLVLPIFFFNPLCLPPSPLISLPRSSPSPFKSLRLASFHPTPIRLFFSQNISTVRSPAICTMSYLPHQLHISDPFLPSPYFNLLVSTTTLIHILPFHPCIFSQSSFSHYIHTHKDTLKCSIFL